MLYESVVGETPFQGPPLAIMAQHVRGVPEPPRARNPAITPSLEALILRLLAKEPADRPASGLVVAAALREEIARVPDGWRRLDGSVRLRVRRRELGGGTSARSSPTPRPRSRPTRRRWRRMAPVLARGELGVGDDAFARSAAGDAGTGPRDAGGGSGRADHALARRALPLRPLSRLPAGRSAAAGPPAPPQARPPQRRPRAAAAGADGGPGRQPRGIGPRRGDRAGGRAPGDAPRGPPPAQPDGRHEVPGLPRHTREAETAPPGPQADPAGQPLRAAADDRRQRGAQPRPDPAVARRPAADRPRPDRDGRPARRPLEPRERCLAGRPRVPRGRAPLRDPARRRATRPAPSSGPRSSIR